MRILVLNPGSSTLKAALVKVEADGFPETAADATIDWPAGTGGADAIVARGLEAVGEVDAVGYRVVHGGPEYQAATPVDEALVDAVKALDPLAPLHNARAAEVMRAGRAALGDIPHVACFDTAFHAGLPEEAWRYPLPPEWIDRWGIRRFGFHGLSVAWASRRAAELLGRPGEDLGLVVVHLGSGCSVTAVEDGRSVDTSMGFTPYEGLMMGTRAGSIDPGILLHLAAAGIAVDELAEGLAERSGLAAVGGSSDVRELERRAGTGDAAGQLALTMFERRAAAGIAAAATTLRRLDGLVFTGGIGEHSGGIRGAIVRRLGILGIPPSLEEPDGLDAVVVAGPPAVLVVAAREELVIAGEVAALLRHASA
jgi:acetate kinase